MKICSDGSKSDILTVAVHCGTSIRRAVHTVMGEGKGRGERWITESIDGGETITAIYCS